jgi:hypothetical protein
LKKVASIQSSYIPWKGYFDVIRNVDLFIFYDNAQFTIQDWRSRNCIKTPQGKKWLTIPCGHNIKRKIYEVNLNDNNWQRSHFDIIKQNYKKAPYYWKYAPFLQEIYLSRPWKNLSDFNQYVTKKIATELLGVNTIFEDSRSYDIHSSKADGVKELIEKCGADIYLMGPAAKAYLNDNFIKTIKVKFVWMDYSNYPEYNQLYPPFEHYVSIIDLILNEGDNAINFMKSFSLENEVIF